MFKNLSNLKFDSCELAEKIWNSFNQKMKTTGTDLTLVTGLGRGADIRSTSSILDGKVTYYLKADYSAVIHKQ